jgi:hypothetical protein
MVSKHALEVAKLAKKGVSKRQNHAPAELRCSSCSSATLPIREDGQFNPEMLIEPLPEELAYAMKSALARLPRGIHYP